MQESEISMYENDVCMHENDICMHENDICMHENEYFGNKTLMHGMNSHHDPDATVHVYDEENPGQVQNAPCSNVVIFLRSRHFNAN